MPIFACSRRARRLLTVLGSLSGALAAGLSPRPLAAQTPVVTVDRARHEVTIEMGPLGIGRDGGRQGRDGGRQGRDGGTAGGREGASGHEHGAAQHAGGGHGEAMAAAETAWTPFEWPVTGWLRGFRLELVDGAGRPLDRSYVHHLVVAHLERAQLVHPAVERLLAVGQETGDAMLPSTVGVPVEAGAELALRIAFHDPGAREVEGARVRLHIRFLPADWMPRPVAVLPFMVDVGLADVLCPNTYDLPPGRSERAMEFTLPASGRLLAASGHLHDWGGELRLEDAATGEILSRVRAHLEEDGSVRYVERRLHGVWGRGVRLEAGRRYRVVATYDNPTGAPIAGGGMSHFAGLFAPDDLRALPPLDLTNPQLAEDLRRRRGEPERPVACP